MRIYVAGPYSAPTEMQRERHVLRAMDVALLLFHKGHTPFVPHLTHYLDVLHERRFGSRLPWEHWMEQDIDWLQKCEALLQLAPSRGADLELEIALSLGLKVYFSVDDVPDGDPEPPPVVLTRRQKQVLDCLASGLTNMQIAADLNIGVHCAAKHVALLLDKLKAPNRRAAVAVARELGLFDGSAYVR